MSAESGRPGWVSGLSLLQRLLLLEAGVFFVILVGVLLFAAEFTASMRDDIEERRLLLSHSFKGRLDAQIEAATTVLALAAPTMPSTPGGHSPVLDRIVATANIFDAGAVRTDADYVVVDTDARHAQWGGKTLPSAGSAVPILSAPAAFIWPFAVTDDTGASTDFVAIALPLDAGSLHPGGFLVGLSSAAASPFRETLELARAIDHTGHADLVTLAGVAALSTELDEIGIGDHPDLYRRFMAREVMDGTYEVEEGSDHADPHTHIMSIVRLQTVPWALALGGDKSETLQPVRRLWFAVFGVTGVVGLLASTFTVLGAARLVRPVREIGVAARRVAAGELDTPIAIKEGGEIGELADSIDSMRASLFAWGTELDHRVADRTVELRARNEELATTSAVAQALASTLEVGTVLDTVADGVVSHLHVDAVFFLLDGLAGRSPEFHASAGVRDTFAQLDPRTCDLGRELRAGSLDEEQGRERIIACLSRHGLEFQSVVTIPLTAGANVRGVMGVAHKDRGFPAGGRQALELIGAEVEIGLQNAFLYEGLRLREAHVQALFARVLNAQEEERSRLARELHDDLAQSLTALLMGFDAIARGIPTGSMGAKRIDDLQRMGREMLDNLRRTILALRPSALDDLGLVAAIERFADRMVRSAGIDVEVESHLGNRRLSPDSEVAVFRIVQEALNNVVRHSGARQASVTLRREDGTLQVDVVDNGVGLREPVDAGDGLDLAGVGLEGMRERALLLGGKLTISGVEGGGTRVGLVVPQVEHFSGESTNG